MVSELGEHADTPHIPAMSVNDTSVAAQKAVDRRYAEMSFIERAERVRAVTVAANQMALAGLRLRHPDASESELLLALARLRLGDDLVGRVYGAG
jgi:hypothetical protein